MRLTYFPLLESVDRRASVRNTHTEKKSVYHPKLSRPVTRYLSNVNDYKPKGIRTSCNQNDSNGSIVGQAKLERTRFTDAYVNSPLLTDRDYF